MTEAKRKRRLTVLVLIGMILISGFLIYNYLSPPVVPEDPMAHWNVDNWASNPGDFNIYNSTFARSSSVEVRYYPERKNYSATFGVPQYVEDEEGWWQPYVFKDHYSEGYYLVQTGLIAVEIRDHYARFYSPDMSEVRLEEERWEVERWETDRWVSIGAQSGTPHYSITTNSSGVFIEKSFHGWAGWLNITYVFRVGNSLKHYVVWKSEISEETTFRVVQKWGGIVGSKVRNDEGNIYEISGSIIVNSTTFRFAKSDQNLLGNNFTVFEDQIRMESYLQPVEVDVHPQGMKCDFVFSSWTLTSGESLVVDPATATLSPPSKDSHVIEHFKNTNKGSIAYLCVQGGFSEYGVRPLVEFDISSIPAGSTFTLGKIRLNCYDAETGRTYEFRRITGAWVEDEVTWNNQPAVTETHGVDVDSPSETGWYETTVTAQVQDARDAGTVYGVRIKDSDETGDSLKCCYFRSKEYDGDDPELYVEYTIPNTAPTIISASISDRDDTDNCYAMKKYYSFVAVVNDADGATDIAKVYLRGKNGATVLWEVRADSLTGTASWSIYSGATIIDLDTGSCTFGEAGDVGTATFKVRLEWDHNNLADLEIAVYVEDSAGASAGWTDMQTNYWDAINRLVTTGFSASDTRINKGTSVTLSGNVRYATTVSGNTASSSHPPDGQFVAVHIHDSSHTSKGSDTSIVNGAFSVTFNIPDAVQSNTYHVYLDMAGDYSDADAPDGDMVSVIGDQIKVVFSVDHDQLFTGETATFTVSMLFDYDESPVTSYSYDINRDGVGFGNPHISSHFTDLESSPASHAYDFTGITDNTYGITAFVDPGDLTVTWSTQEITITLATNPSGLNVRLDGGSWYAAPHDYTVDSGSSHLIECQSPQGGGTRKQYVWISWSDSGVNPHNVAPSVDTTCTATYKTQYQVFIDSNPQGSGFVKFDGNPETTPYTSPWYDEDTTKTVEATDKIIVVDQERYVFASWSDGKSQSHSITIDGGSYTATFTHQWYFKVNSAYDAPTGEGWYDDGASVHSTVTTPSEGHVTTGWTGTGSLASGGTTGSDDTGYFTINEYSTCTWNWEGINHAPIITSLAIFSNGNPISSLDPLQGYEFTVEVQDLDQFSDLSSVEVYLWSSEGSEGSYSKRDGYGFKWVNSGGSWSVSELGPGGSLNPVLCTKPDDMSATSGEFMFYVSLGGVANPSSWTFKAYVYDSQDASDDDLMGFSVEKYLYYSVLTDTVNWGTLDPGDTNQIAITPASGLVTISITCNYNVKIQIKGDTDLSDGQEHTIPLTNVYVGQTSDPSRDGINLSTEYQDFITGASYGENQVFNSYWFLSIPADQHGGDYSFTWSIQVVEE